MFSKDIIINLDQAMGISTGCDWAHIISFHKVNRKLSSVIICIDFSDTGMGEALPYHLTKFWVLSRLSWLEADHETVQHLASVVDRFESYCKEHLQEGKRQGLMQKSVVILWTLPRAPACRISEQDTLAMLRLCRRVTASTVFFLNQIFRHKWLNYI